MVFGWRHDHQYTYKHITEWIGVNLRAKKWVKMGLIQSHKNDIEMSSK